jgi:hypothetical protein
MADQRIFDSQNRCIGILQESSDSMQYVYDGHYNRLGYYLPVQGWTCDNSGNRIGYGDQRMRLIN